MPEEKQAVQPEPDTKEAEDLEEKQVQGPKEEKPVVDELEEKKKKELSIWKKARKTADGQILKEVKKDLGLEFDSVDDLKLFVKDILQDKEESEKETEETIKQNKSDKTSIEKEFKRELSELRKFKERYETVEKEKTELKQRYRDEKLESLFKTALINANCNDPDLLVGNKKIVSKLQLDDDMRDVSILDNDGDITHETLEDYVEILVKKHPKLFTAVRANPVGRNLQFGNPANNKTEATQRGKAIIDNYLTSKRK